MKTAALVSLLAVILVATLLAGIYLWWSLGDVDISIHGLIAMTLGCLVSLALGGGLMFLVFYSNRRGHDEQQQRGPQP
jgi:predicted transporter